MSALVPTKNIKKEDNLGDKLTLSCSEIKFNFLN